MRVNTSRWALVGSVSIRTVTGVRRTDLIADQGGYVLQQAADAGVRLPSLVVLVRRPGLGSRRAAGLGDGVYLGGRPSSVTVSSTHAWRRCQIS